MPQVSIEFDVAGAAAVSPAARELEQAGYELLHQRARSGVARPRSPVIGMSYAPMLHTKTGGNATGILVDRLP